MSPVSAGERVQRILTIVPWIVGRPGVALDEVCRRFGIGRDELIADLSLLTYVGLPPYTPDMLIDVAFDEDRVTIHLADPFDRPLRLTAEQALALVAAGASLRTVPGADPGDPLQRGLAKLAAALGVEADDVVDIDLGPVSPTVLATLQAAVAERRRVEIDYYAYGRDELTRREVDPHRVVAEQGSWYLEAWCHRAEGQRLFRIDRISAARPLDATFATPELTESLTRFAVGAHVPRVTLELAPAARWVADQYPHEGVEELPGGRLRVRIAVSERPWLERLLVRLGPAAQVVDADGPDLADAGATAAARILRRYRPADAGGATATVDPPG